MKPDALAALQAACAATGQRAVAQRLGLAQATLSLTLRGKYMASDTHIERRVRERLMPAGEEAPWLAAMRRLAQEESQEEVALRLGVSAGTVSAVLSGTYGASTARIERRARGELLGEQCECPAMGDVSLLVCQAVQERPAPSMANPMHGQAWFACRGQGRFHRAGRCPHFTVGGARPAATKEDGDDRGHR